jgi:hypothetical protein
MKELTQDGRAVFPDGSEECIDAVIYCTGKTLNDTYTRIQAYFIALLGSDKQIECWDDYGSKCQSSCERVLQDSNACTNMSVCVRLQFVGKVAVYSCGFLNPFHSVCSNF